MRNFNKAEHARLLKVAGELLTSGLPAHWISQKLGINYRTVINSTKPSMRTKLSHGTDRFQAVIKNYTYRQLNARGKEAQLAKELTEEWLGINRVTDMFGLLDMFVKNLFVPSYLPTHRGYRALLKEVLDEGPPSIESLWQEYLSILGRCLNDQFPLPKNLAELEERFTSFVADRCRNKIGPAWSEEAHQRIDKVLTQLLPREAQIINMRFAMGGETTASTLRKIEQNLGISAERIRQIEQKALQKLRLPVFRDALRHAIRTGGPI